MAQFQNLRKKFFVCVLVTDGNIKRKILTVKYTGNHFVFIYPVKGQDNHITYHKDGWVLESLSPNGRVFRKQQYSALDNFTGDAPHFGAFLNIDKPSTWGSVPHRTEAKEIVIDLRSCIGKTNVVSVDAPLLVPGDFEPLNVYSSFNILKCEVFTETIPWLAVIGYYST